jgi:hypothetical protein
MKLRLFGCAAAYALAGTLCVSAQEAPQSKNKEGAPQAESRDKSPAREMKEAPANRSENAERGSQGNAGSDRADRKADKADAKSDRKAAKDESDTKRNRPHNDSPASEKEKSDKAADKSDRAGSGKSSNTANDNANAQRDKAAKRDDKSEIDRSAESKRDSSGAKDREQATDRTDKVGADKAAKVQLSADKRDRVQSTLRSDANLKHETKVDVDIAIGARAPRTWTFAPVPVAVVELVPEYRGYVVAYVEDEYVICDPDTYEVVALLPASGGGDYATTGRSSGEGGAGTQCTTSLTLSESDRDAILNEVQMSDEIDASGVTVGWSVPSDVDLKSLPPSIVDRSASLSGCRYFVVDGQVALVNPDQHEVVLLIEQR